MELEVSHVDGECGKMVADYSLGMLDTAWRFGDLDKQVSQNLILKPKGTLNMKRRW
jgi:hypothetical protein